MNSFSFSQISTVLNSIVAQATGQANLTAITNTGDFASVAQVLLSTGRDPVMNAISQVWSNTIFAYRDYNAPMADLEFDATRWGNAVRKLSPIADVVEDDQCYKWPVAYDAGQTPPLGNGQSVDHYKIHKQEVLQTNFYGSGVYEQIYTIFKDQFDCAFTSPEELGRFFSMLMAERNNDRESYKEGLARGLQANFIGSLIDENNTTRVVKLLTEYNTLTGGSLTVQDIWQPIYIGGFVRWCYGRIRSIAKAMSQRSEMYQTVISSKHVLRHTSPENLRIALFAPFMEQIRAQVLSTTFNDEYLKGAKWEDVVYWQSIETPDSIKLTPTYTDTSGVLKTGSAITQDAIVGIMHDRDAIGYNLTNQWSAVTPLNISGGYWNEAHHMTVKTLSDVTEKAVVLLLE